MDFDAIRPRAEIVERTRCETRRRVHSHWMKKTKRTKLHITMKAYASGSKSKMLPNKRAAMKPRTVRRNKEEFMA
jgi:hypothetical protein